MTRGYEAVATPTRLAQNPKFRGIRGYPAVFRSSAAPFFGAGRLLRGSDWPVLNLAGDYASWHKTCRQWTAELSAAEQRAIFGDNAIRFYGFKVGRGDPE